MIKFKHNRTFIRLSFILVGSSQLLACSSAPKSQVPIVEMNAETYSHSVTKYYPQVGQEKGREILNIAEAYLGTPYRYGGDDPTGFDCSGLVQFSHQNVGIKIPRTAADQYRAAHSIAKAELKPGDVIFFRLNWRKISHVGIYAGKGQFIHAPTTGKRVSLSSLNAPYWKKRVAKTGRFY